MTTPTAPDARILLVDDQRANLLLLEDILGAAGKREPVAFGPLVAETAKMLKRMFPPAVAITADIAPDLWPVAADATQMHQVLTNLGVNARDAMPAGGALTFRATNVRTEAPPPGLKGTRFVRLEVSDTGTGIPPEVAEKIFDPFFTTKEIGKGTGLGLSTVQGIVASHGGALRLDSEVGRGTTFVIDLPALTPVTPDTHTR